jgi:hypothetical protein
MSKISRIDPSRYADTGFSVADIPPELNNYLFRKIMEKSGAELIAIGWGEFFFPLNC